MVQGGELKSFNLTKGAFMLENFHQCKPGYCLNCNSVKDLEASRATISIAELCFQRYVDTSFRD